MRLIKGVGARHDERMAMKKTLFVAVLALVLGAGSYTVFTQGGAGGAAPAAGQKPQMPMSFFITSVGKGNGANLGGIAGADAHCAMLAQAAGATEDLARLSQHAGRRAP